MIKHFSARAKYECHSTLIIQSDTAANRAKYESFGVRKAMNIRRGDIYYADLSPVVGSEESDLFLSSRTMSVTDLVPQLSPQR